MTGTENWQTLNALEFSTDPVLFSVVQKIFFISFRRLKDKAKTVIFGPYKAIRYKSENRCLSVSHGAKIDGGLALGMIKHLDGIPLLSEITTLVLNRAATVSFYSIQMDNWHLGFNPHLLIFIKMGLHYSSGNNS
ncbi:hypothetical protein GHU80_012385 [Escherichia coli]